MKLIIPIACFAACLALTCGKRCETEDDCDDGQCCVALTTSQMMRKGLCLKLSRAGRKCNEPGAKVDYYGGKYLRYCPCQDGLTCEAKRKRIRTIGAAAPVMICKKPAAATVPPTETEEPEVTTNADEIVEETTTPEIEEETTIPEIVEETTITEIVEETTAPDETGDETGEEGTGDETVGEETGDETVDEGNGDETPDEGVDDELEGPGGEPPRDDDCEDWELPC